MDHLHFIVYLYCKFIINFSEMRNHNFPFIYHLVEQADTTSDCPDQTMASQTKLKKPNSHFSLCTFLFFTVLFTIPALFLLRTSSSCSSSTTAAVSPSSDTNQPPWSGDLQTAQFAWNRLAFSLTNPPPKTLKLAVFSRKWPTGPNPGGMERHAFTLYTALARRGHHVHVFTSPLDPSPQTNKITPASDKTLNPTIHSHGDAEPGKWRYNKAWELYQEENKK